MGVVARMVGLVVALMVVGLAVWGFGAAPPPAGIETEEPAPVAKPQPVDRFGGCSYYQLRRTLPIDDLHELGYAPNCRALWVDDLPRCPEVVANRTLYLGPKRLCKP